ncbi:MAG: hypothetical protein WCD83_00740 [Pseudolabrys sp.]
MLCDFSSKLLSRYGKGQQTRPFCYVDNLIDGLIKLIKGVGPIRDWGQINIDTRANFPLGNMVVDMTGSRTRFVDRPIPQNDPRQRRPDISRGQGYYHGSLLVILTTDFGLSLLASLTKPAGHVVRA